jgi:hypothetical protein
MDVNGHVSGVLSRRSSCQHCTLVHHVTRHIQLTESSTQDDRYIRRCTSWKLFDLIKTGDSLQESLMFSLRIAWIRMIEYIFRLLYMDKSIHCPPILW